MHAACAADTVHVLVRIQVRRRPWARVCPARRSGRCVCVGWSRVAAFKAAGPAVYLRGQMATQTPTNTRRPTAADVTRRLAYNPVVTEIGPPYGTACFFVKVANPHPSTGAIFRQIHATMAAEGWNDLLMIGEDGGVGLNENRLTCWSEPNPLHKPRAAES